MISTRENEYCAVLDACVLVPAALCDVLLRLAEEPAMHRPRWSDGILSEMASALRSKLGRTAAEVSYRRRQMNAAFPEAMVQVPDGLIRGIEGIPDEGDRHVLAAAIVAHADVIVTQNIKHFPKACLEGYGLLCQTADDFLVHQFHRNIGLVLDKIDDQAAAIGKDRRYVISSLKRSVPQLASLIEESYM